MVIFKSCAMVQLVSIDRSHLLAVIARMRMAQPTTLPLDPQDRQTTSSALGSKPGLKLFVRRSPPERDSIDLNLRRAHPGPSPLICIHHSQFKKIFAFARQTPSFRDILLLLYSDFLAQWRKIRSH
jgi:hypothetical protein